MVKKILTATLLVPTFSLSLYTMPALADEVIVTNVNGAEVLNVVLVGANTGENSADGGSGGSGGDGGDIYNGSGGDQDVDDSSTGDGGSGGNGGWGGLILTGDADAGASVTNVVNSNDTDIAPCDCEQPDPCNGECDDCDDCDDRDDCDWDDCDCDDECHDPCDCDLVVVTNVNYAAVGNLVGVVANTGANNADGNSGGSGGDGGDIDNYGYDDDQDVDDSHTGAGGTGGTGGDGGLVATGWATAGASVVNVVNTNLTRIRH